MKTFLFSLLFIPLVLAQPISFDELDPDTVLTEFITDGFKFVSDQMATNYGNNFNTYGTSLYMYQSDIEVTKLDSTCFDVNDMRVYQVSEKTEDSLIVEGWLDNIKKYDKVFAEINNWQTLELNFFYVDKMVVKSKRINDDYNIDEVGLRLTGFSDFFLIEAWLTITPPTVFYTDSTSVMLLEFSRSVDTTGLFNENNYSITDDDSNSVPIYQIGIVDTIDGIVIPDTSLIALLIPRAAFKKSYTTVVSNLTDKDGTPINTEKNTGWYYHGGYAPNLIEVPELRIRKGQP